MSSSLTIALAQIAPVWLNRQLTREKIGTYMGDAADLGADLVAFGEGLLPGYPFWVELTDGALFNNEAQKEAYALYVSEAVNIHDGDLEPLCEIAKDKRIAAYVGIIEKAHDRGGHSLYASMVYINKKGSIQSVHRKLMPTHEERLVWSPGDGHGLQVHKLGNFTVGGLNCWENWMPLARSALYAQGEDLHVAIWPGNFRNTGDITVFIAKEARSYVMSVSGLFRQEDISPDLPFADKMLERAGNVLADGGSCLAGPDGNWIITPFTNEEKLELAEIDHNRVNRERQNFDPSGHYSRPDVTKLEVNRQRQSTVDFND